MDYKYDHIIKSVTSKREDYINRYHTKITGAKCAVGLMEIGYKGGLLIDIFNMEDTPYRHWYYTSPVESVGSNGDGDLVIETMNSTYILTPIKGGDSK